MRKIADAAELESKLRQLLAYTESEQNPSRSQIAAELRDLSDRLAGTDKTAAPLDARAYTDQLFTMKNRYLDPAVASLNVIRRLWERMGSTLNFEFDNEADAAYQHFRTAQDNLIDCSEAMQKVFDKMGWR